LNFIESEVPVASAKDAAKMCSLAAAVASSEA